MYEKDLKVPYYFRFDTDNKELMLYRHNGKSYDIVLPNPNGRRAVPALELEVGMLGNWVRFWHRGELLMLPAELDQAVMEARQKLAELNARREAESLLRLETPSRPAEPAQVPLEVLRREIEELRAKLKHRQPERPSP
jgi:hypothetical protein